jgi:uncharacterized protein (DUF1501 family)
MWKMIQNLNKLLALTTLTIVLAACSYNQNLVTSSYKILSVSQEAYTTAMKTASSLDSKGLLTRQQRAEIIRLGEIYYQAHNSAVDTLYSYEKHKTSDAQTRLLNQLTSTSAALSNLLTTLEPYIKD